MAWRGPWASPASVAVLAGGAVLFAVFLVTQARIAEPVLPLWVLRRRVLVGANLSQMGVGIMLIALTS